MFWKKSKKNSIFTHINLNSILMKKLTLSVAILLAGTTLFAQDGKTKTPEKKETKMEKKEEKKESKNKEKKEEKKESKMQERKENK